MDFEVPTLPLVVKRDDAPRVKTSKVWKPEIFQRNTWMDTPTQGQRGDEMDPKWVWLWFSSSWVLIIE